MTTQVRGLLDRILDGEAAAMAVEMIAAGNSPACLRSTRSDKAARTFPSCKPLDQLPRLKRLFSDATAKIDAVEQSQ